MHELVYVFYKHLFTHWSLCGSFETHKEHFRQILMRFWENILEASSMQKPSSKCTWDSSRQRVAIKIPAQWQFQSGSSVVCSDSGSSKWILTICAMLSSSLGFQELIHWGNYRRGPCNLYPDIICITLIEPCKMCTKVK